MGGAAGLDTLTILFTDVEGSTAYRTSAGDAAGNLVMGAHERLVAEQVTRHDGRLIKSLGDGCLAVFSSPRRAVECAVAVQRETVSSPLRVRIGVNSGEVTLTADDVFGSAVNAAARIAAKAQGGEIFVSDVVRQLMGSAASAAGLELRDRGRVRLRGFPDRWRLYEVVWRDERTAAGNPELTPFVGRAAELARLHRVLDNLATGRGAAVVIRGEAGIGKTRLATEALDFAHSRGWRVLVGRASPFGGGLGLEPVVEAFGGLLRGLDQPALTHLVADLPHLGRLFEGIGLPPAPPVSDPALERTLLFESVARMFERLARVTPTVLMIDDVQWADPASLELLHQLGRGIDRHPAALLLTYRPGERDEGERLRGLLVALRRQRVIEEVELGRLDPQAVAALAREFLGGRPPPGLLDILVRAAGTPLYVDALLRGLLDRGQLARAGEAWTLQDTEIEVPLAVRDVIGERLDGLAPPARRVVELVALTGGALAYEVLVQTGELAPDILSGAVEYLTSCGLLLEEYEGDLAYRLAHPLYYEVAAGLLTEIARRRGHAVLATALERLHPADLEGLARHYLAAGPALPRGRALEVLADAGQGAARRRAYAEAVRFLEAAVALARRAEERDRLPVLLENLAEAAHGSGRTDDAVGCWGEALALRQPPGSPTGDAFAVARIRRALGLAQFERGRLAQAREELEAAVHALEREEPSAELADLQFARAIVLNRLGLSDELSAVADQLADLAVALDSAPANARAAYARAVSTADRGEPAGAVQQALDGLEWARAAGDDAVAYRLHTVCCDAAVLLGDHALLLEHSQAGMRLVSSLGFGVLVGGAGLYRVFGAIQSGAWDEAMRFSDEELEIVHRFGNDRRTVTVLGFRAWLFALRGDLVEAAELVAGLKERFPPSMYADRRGFGMIPVLEACVAIERGEPARARAALEDAHQAATDYVGWLVVSYAEALARSGDPDAARRATRTLPEFPSPFLAAVRAYVDGLVHAAFAEVAAGVDSFSDSVRRFDDMRMPFYAARSRLERAKLLAGAEPGPAAADAEHALAAFRALGAKLYAERAEALLATLGVGAKSRPVRARVVRSGPLSRRQVEVARLVSEGLTNAEIAEQLFLSVRTVTTHLDHIYTRLGITSRAALARQVATAPEEFRVDA